MVSGLAFRCLTRYSQKYRSTSDGRSAVRAMVLLDTLLLLSGAVNKALEAFAYRVHEVRNRGHIPIRIGDLDVPQIGRQRWESHLDIDTLAVPCQKAAANKAVAQIVKARQLIPLFFDPAQLTTQILKSPQCLFVGQRRAIIREKESSTVWAVHSAVAKARIFSQRARRCRVYDDDSRLRELRLSHGEDVALQVHVTPVQP